MFYGAHFLSAMCLVELSSAALAHSGLCRQLWMQDKAPGAGLSAKLKTEYDIPMEYKEGVGQMCNLGEGIWERGIAEGKAEVIYAMYDKGMSVEQIAQLTGMDIKEVESALLQSNVLSSN